ncbi:MAG: hypothetical protein QM743_05830 [Chitinophagaceae bacterium]
MVFTKADKNTQREAAKNVSHFIDAMREEWEFIPRSFITSSVKHLGRKDMLQYISELIEQYENELSEQQ